MTTEDANNQNASGELSLDDVDKMSIDQLKEQLRHRGSIDTGRKADLKFRLMTLIAADAQKDTNESDDDKEDEVIDEAESGDVLGDGSDECQSEVRSFNKLSFRDVEESIEVFTGDDSRKIETWIQNLEDLNTIAGWSNSELFVYAKRLLNGSAKSFIRTQSGLNTWKKLKECLIEEFQTSINSRDIHEKLSRRRKRENESWRQYMYDMMEIAKPINLETEAMISYLVDGIEDESSDKFILRGARNLNELKAKFEEYERVKRNKKTNKKLNVYKPKPKAESEPVKKIPRCYSCGNKGHEASKCPQLSKGPKCFKCNNFGHVAKECKRNEFQDQNINIIQKSPSMIITMEANGETLEALIDTGSMINLIRKDVYIKIGSPACEMVNKSFIGFGGAMVSSEAKFSLNITIQNENYDTIFYVVPSNSLSSPVILGTELLNQADVLISRNTIKFNKIKNNKDNHIQEILHINCVQDDDELNVEKPFKKQIEDLKKNYSVAKTIKTTSVKTNIILKDETPIYLKPRRLAPLEKRVLEKQVEEWLKDGVIVPSQSEFSSPVVIVRKKNGEYRVCIDYRRLNKQIVKDRFPMALIEDQLDQLAEAKVFTTIDLKNGFLHVPIAEGSTKYTAFSTPDNQYEFVKTPFGLCNSPASFGRFINEVFRELIKEKTILQYVDDLIIPSKNEAEGIQKLQRVLKVASEYGIHINWKKCAFLKRTIEYLGYIISDSQLRPSPNKVRAVLTFPKPKNTKDIQSFLGLSGYFRKFIEGHSIIAAPLSKLLKKNADFVFGPEQEAAFSQLKKCLSEEPVLRIYKPTAITEVHTDACQDGIAAVLLQKDNEQDEFHPVVYMSKTTSPSEKKYHSYELEVLAVVTALKKFRPYLLGIPFKLVTDCAAFQRTVHKAEIPNKVARWTLDLEEYDYTMEHRSSERMRHVDALSRNIVMLIRDTLTSSIAENQNKDEKLIAIKKILESQQYEDYNMQNGVLMKFINGKNVIVVPSSMQKEIIRKIHDDGHFGTKKMKELINREYFIDNLEKKLENHIQCCVPCILATRKKGKKEGQLYPIPKDETPLSTLHVDHLGPMTATSKKYMYLFVIVDAFSKFTWIYPTKTTNTKEVLDKLELQAKTFGDPGRIISDRGAAFTSKEFEAYCKDRSIEHLCITTGVPRGNGQVERQNQIIISVLSKLAADDPTKWYRFVDQLQRCMNSTYQRSIGFSPYEVLIGVKMKNLVDSSMLSILQEEMVKMYDEARDDLRQIARENIMQMQEEQKRTYNRKRKAATKYKPGDIIAIKRTQYGTAMKLRNKFLGPYKVIKIKGNERYDVQKLGDNEGPKFTSTSADQMKLWRTESSGSDDN